MQAGADDTSFLQGITATIANGDAATIDTAGHQVTISSNLQTQNGGDAGLVKMGQGTLILSGMNTYVGGTTVQSGTLEVSSDGNLGTGDITLGNSELLTSANFSTNKAVALSSAFFSNSGLSAVTGTTATYQGVISGGSLIINDSSNAGTVILAGTNTYSGGTSISAGTLVVSSDANLGTGDLALTGGSGLTTTANFATDKDITVFMPMVAGASLDGNLSAVFGTTATYNGAISGNGGLAINNLTFPPKTTPAAGVIVLAGDNTYTGGTTITLGTLVVSSDANLGTGNLTLDGGTTLLTTANFTTDKAITLVPAAQGSPAANDTLSAATGTTATYQGAIDGSGSLGINDTSDAGTVILAGTNAYTGGTTIALGTLEVSSDANLGTGGLTLDGGTTLLTTADFTTNKAITLNPARKSISPNDTLSAATGTAATYQGSIAGDGSLGINDSSDAGTVVLAGTNTYTGGTTVMAGTLEVSSAANLGTGDVTLYNQTTLLTMADFTTNASIEVNTSKAPKSVSTATLSAVTGTTATYDGEIIADNLDINDSSDAGIIVLTGENAVDGDITIQAGTLEVSSDANLGDGELALDGGATLLTTANFTTDKEIALNPAAAGALSSNGTLSAATGTTATYNGNISGSGSLGINDSADAGTVILTGENAINGDTTINAGTLEIASSDNLGTAGITFVSGKLLTTTTTTIAAPITLTPVPLAGSSDFGPAGGTLAAADGTTATYTGVIADGSLSSGSQQQGTRLLVNDGTNNGTVVLAATNTYAGGTEVVSGTLAATGTDSLGKGAVQVDSAATLLLFGSDSNTALDNQGTFLGNGTFDFSHSIGRTFTGDFDNDGLVSVLPGSTTIKGVTYTTPGTLTLGGTGYLVNETDGTFAIGADETLNLATTGFVTNFGLISLSDATAKLSGQDMTNSGTLSGNGTVTNNIDNYYGTISAGPAATLNLTGTVTNDKGGLLLAQNAGTLDVAALVSDATSEIEAETGGTVQVQSDFTNNGLISLSNGSFTTGAFALTNDGTISGYGQLTANGGFTTSGTVSLNGGTSTVNGSYDMTGGTTDVYSAANFNSSVTVNGGSFTTHNANVVIAGALTVNGGSYNNDPSTTQVNSLNVGANGTLTGGSGSLFEVQTDVSNASVNFRLGQGGLTLAASPTNAHTFTWSVNTSMLDIGIFTIDAGQTVDFENGGITFAALMTGSFQLTDALGAGDPNDVRADVDKALSGDLLVYYDPSVASNSYLDDQTYSFGNGGLLTPKVAPEPSILSLFLLGGLGIAFVIQRKKKGCGCTI